MNIPNIVDSKIIDDNKYLTDVWRQIFTQLFSEMQVHLSDEGFVVPQQTSDNILELSTEQSIGAILYNGDTDQFEGAFKKVVGTIVTSEFKPFQVVGGDIITGAIELTSLTPNTAVVSNSTNDLVSSITTDLELSYVHGVTSDIQSQINGKEPAISSGTNLQYWRGDKTWQTLDTKAVPENTNLYFTDSRARGSISSSATGLTYTSSTGVFSLTTGYVIPTTTEVSNWNTAYSWGNHAGLYLKLDQTSPENVINGKPNFAIGLNAGSSGATLSIDEVGSGAGNQSVGTPGVDAPYYSGSGAHYQIKVWAYKTVGDYTVYSQNPYVIDFYDDPYSPPEWFWIHWTWSAVAGATGYKIQYTTLGNDPFGAYLYCTTNELIDRWYLSIPAWQYASGITTPSNPTTSYSITALTVNDNVDIKGNLDVGNILRTRGIITEQPLSLGTTDQKGMLTINSAAMFPGIYIDSISGGNICLNSQDGVDQLRFSVNGTVVSAAITYLDASIEWWGGSNGSIYFNGDSSVDAPGGFGSLGSNTGITFSNGYSIKDNGNDLYVNAPNTTFANALTLEPIGTAPATPLEGMMYVNNTAGNHLYIYLNSSWNLLI